MIAKLIGTVDLFEEDSIILNVSGVGYQVYSPVSFISTLTVSQDLSIFIQTIVKEDSITLYGFESLEQKKLFNLILTVQGVGPKLALVLLSKYEVEEIQASLITGNIELLKSVSGIGAKVAQRLITELKDKTSKIFDISLENLKSQATVVSKNQFLGCYLEAKDALKSIGYSPAEINQAFTFLEKECSENLPVEEIIKEALKYFAKGI